MEQQIIEKKPVGRPKKAEKPSMVQYVVSYKLFLGNAFVQEKSMNVASPNDLLKSLKAYEQDKADRAAEAAVHVNTPTEFMEEAFDRKRKSVRIVITGFFQIPIITLLLILFALPVSASTAPPTQFVASYYDGAGKKCHVSYDGKVVSIYYPAVSQKEVTIIENRVRFTAMPQTFTTNGITFTRRRNNSAGL